HCNDRRHRGVRHQDAGPVDHGQQQLVGPRSADAGRPMRLPDEMIESLLWSLGAPESGDGQRRSPRLAMGCIAMLTPLEDGCAREAAAREVLVRDISATGASLLL